MNNSKKFLTKYIEITQNKRIFYLLKIPANLLTTISYVAKRGVDKEEGAVQRILNKARIKSLKDYTINVGNFPSAVVLNWTSKDELPKFKNGEIEFFISERLAQVIDGQHRIEGLRDAIKEKKSISNLEIPVTLYINLGTPECADIFLSINTEQKPVPPSLVYDLYEVASVNMIDVPSLRARDIAKSLNDSEESPYYDEIKFPGSPKKKGGIALSTVVSSIKPLLDEGSILHQIGIKDFETQQRIILNLFIALSNKYKQKWDDRSNVFLYAAGFASAIKFFELKLVPFCNNEESFTIETIENALDIRQDNLILQSIVKGSSGSKAVNTVYEELLKAFVPEKANKNIAKKRFAI